MKKPKKKLYFLLCWSILSDLLVFKCYLSIFPCNWYEIIYLIFINCFVLSLFASGKYFVVVACCKQLITLCCNFVIRYFALLQLGAAYINNLSSYLVQPIRLVSY